MLENKFQAQVIKDIKKALPGAIVLKNDSSYMQGIPDLTVLYGSKWAALECKKDADAAKRPNQTYFVNKMNDMSYAAFIFPENKEVILDELQLALKP